MQKKQFEKYTDYEIFSLFLKNKNADFGEVKQALHTLWERYYPLCCKLGIKLNYFKNCNNLHGLDSDDYLASYYDHFLKAINGIKLDKIRNKSTWSFWIQLYGYLRTANRTMVNAYCRQTKVEKSDEIEVDGSSFYISDIDKNAIEISERCYNVEENYFRKSESELLRVAIDKAYNSFSDTEKNIWKGRLEEKNMSAISRDIGTSPTTVKKHLDIMKKKIRDAVITENIKRKETVYVDCLY